MKIAISGAANTGKSTFAKHFAEQNDFPIIEEKFLDFNIIKQSENVAEIVDKFTELDAYKTQKELMFEDRFVSDRCSVDLFVLWSAQPQLRALPISVEFYKKWKLQASKYDYIVFMPWGTIHYANLEDEYTRHLGKRMNPMLNLARHGTLLGLANMWAGPEKTIIVPEEIVDLNERTEWLTQRLGL